MTGLGPTLLGCILLATQRQTIARLAEESSNYNIAGHCNSTLQQRKKTPCGARDHRLLCTGTPNPNGTYRHRPQPPDLTPLRDDPQLLPPTATQLSASQPLLAEAQEPVDLLTSRISFFIHSKDNLQGSRDKAATRHGTNDPPNLWKRHATR